MDEYLTVEIMQGNVLTITCPDGACEQHGIIDENEVHVYLQLMQGFVWKYGNGNNCISLCNVLFHQTAMVFTAAVPY